MDQKLFKEKKPNPTRIPTRRITRGQTGSPALQNKTLRAHYSLLSSTPACHDKDEFYLLSRPITINAHTETRNTMNIIRITMPSSEGMIVSPSPPLSIQYRRFNNGVVTSVDKKRDE